MYQGFALSAEGRFVIAEDWLTRFVRNRTELEMYSKFIEVYLVLSHFYADQIGQSSAMMKRPSADRAKP